MNTAYKITDADSYTRQGQPGETLWRPQEWHRATGPLDGPLCSNSWIHVYADPLLAVLHNPIHGNYQPDTMRLWVCEVGGPYKHDDLMKSGVRRCRVVEEMPMPNVTIINRVAYGILCAMSCYRAPEFTVWAEAWLSGSRTQAAARAAVARAAAARAAEARAAEAAAWAEARAAAAWSAAWSAAAAVWSAEAAARAAGDIDLISCAECAMTIV